MSLKVEYFSAVLVKGLTAAAKTLPVSAEATEDLLALLPESTDFTLLAIKSDTEYEVVKVKNSGCVLSIERGIGGTTPVAHAIGSTVIGVTPLMAEAMKEIIKATKS